MRLRAAALGLALASAACGDAGPDPVAALELSADQARAYQVACASCHARPGTGAPVVGDESEWRERRAKGFEALVANTVNGSAGMPPLGTCGLCSDSDLRALVAYMARIEPR